MSQWTYLIVLTVSLFGLVTLDHRYKLAFWHDARRAVLTIAGSLIFFVVWDLVGIAAGIFYSGDSAYALPMRLLPEFPIEELLFLTLLTYLALLMYIGGLRGYRHIRRR